MIKNKTTMDYEKAYKDALNRAKHALDCHNQGMVSTDVSLITSMFPELREPEDERIRKRLIEFFKDFGKTRSHCWSIYVPDILAWLEKQAQKPTIEMKSAEESLGIDSDTYNEIVDECIYGEQKSQRMISAEAKEAMYDKPSDKIEQKSSWTKEDDVMLDTIEGWLDTLCEYLKDSRCEYIPNVKYCIDRLKSLKERYTWKPSDKQMAILYKYAEQNNYDGSILTSLYNELKKLREE